ncbi:M28 family peptidase [Streptomyces sp. NBC_01803]|nr:M28 family peptidase [Streptomyces sp. NBC_01803]WSA46512.1 M28 family peptidase [Streptomyces sp. NBC_01803]
MNRLARLARLARAGAAALTACLLLTAAAEPRPHATAAAPDIAVADVRAHLADLAAVAEANGGDRAHGQPGYAAAVDHLQALLDEAGWTTVRQEFTHAGATGYNLVAEWPHTATATATATATDETLIAGAHLDTVRSVPGINDNGSGSAVLLEVALAVAEADLAPAKRLRFAWWGAEELGMVGSRHYLDTLPDADRAAVTGYLNSDMTGSANPGYFVYDDDPALAGVLTDWFAARGVAVEPADEMDGRSDHVPFLDAGIPVSGLFTGAGETMTEQQAALWDGTAGEPFDPCYHQACDDTANVSETALDRTADALAHAVWELSA